MSHTLTPSRFLGEIVEDSDIDGIIEEVVRTLSHKGYAQKDIEAAQFTASSALYTHRALQHNIYQCEACELHLLDTCAVTGAGSTASPLMLIGEAPGATEEVIGVPFVGETGMVLNLVLAKLGVDRNRLWTTNAVKHRPPNNRTPSVDELKKCFPHLQHEIEIVQPKVILTLGNPAMHVIRGDDTLKITKERGVIYDYHGIHVLHTFHPSYIYRQTGADLTTAKKLFWSDIRDAVEMAKQADPKYDFAGVLKVRENGDESSQ